MILLVGCLSNEPAIVPTNTFEFPANTVSPPSATIVPPTNTLIPPTAIETPLPPTDTQLPPTYTSVPSVVSPGPNDVNVLVYVPNKYGANLFLNTDNFENLGWHITLTGARK